MGRLLVSGAVGVGPIQGVERAKALVKAGADRIGTSNAISMINE